MSFAPTYFHYRRAGREQDRALSVEERPARVKQLSSEAATLKDLFYTVFGGMTNWQRYCYVKGKPVDDKELLDLLSAQEAALHWRIRRLRGIPRLYKRKKA